MVENEFPCKPFPMLPNHFHGEISSLPRLQTPICNGGGLRGGRLLKRGVALDRPSLVAILLDGCLEARQGRNPTMDNYFPMWEMVSHRGKWCATVGNVFLLFSPFHLTLSAFSRASLILRRRYLGQSCRGRGTPLPKVCRRGYTSAAGNRRPRGEDPWVDKM